MCLVRTKRIHLAAARKAKKLTQAKLAAKLHKPQSHISKLERGTRRVTLGEAIVLGKLLDVDPRSLMFGPSEVSA